MASQSEVTDKISVILSTHELIIKSTLQNLSYNDLISASLVCKNWCAVVRKIQKTRNTKVNCETLNYPADCEIKEVNLFKKITNKEGIPNFCLTFIKREFYMDYSQYLMRKSLKTSDNGCYVQYQLEKSLPQTCVSYLVVGNQFPQSHNKYDPNDTERVMSITLPQIKDVKIEKFHGDAIKDDVDIWIKENLISEKNLSFLLLIGWSAESKLMMDKIVLKLRLKYDNFKVGAVIVACTNMDENKNTSLEGIAFYGNNLHSEVVAMATMDRTSEQIEEKILQLKSNTEITPEKSLILMFSEQQRRVTELDLEMLKTHFPETAIVGTSVFDVLSMSASAEDVPQLSSPIKHWQVPYQPPVCDKRFSGPAQIISLSWK